MRSQRWFFLLLATTPLAGCAAGSPPPDLPEAQRLLQRRDARDLEQLEPELVGEARTSARTAEGHHVEGRAEQAELEAAIALAKLRTAENMVRLQEVRALGERGAAEPELVAKTPPPAASPKPPPRSARAPAEDKRSKAPSRDGDLERAFYDAEDARTDAIGRGAGTDPGFAHADSILEVARAAESRGDVPRAVERAKDARRLYGLLRGVPVVVQAPPPAAPAPAPAPAARAVLAAAPTATFDPAKEEASSLVLEIQRAQATLAARFAGDKRLETPAELVRRAEKWLALGDSKRTIAVAREAQEAQRALGAQAPAAGAKERSGAPGANAAACEEAKLLRARAEGARASRRPSAERSSVISSLLDSSTRVEKSGSCEESRELAREAARLSELAEAPAARPTEPVKREAVPTEAKPKESPPAAAAPRSEAAPRREAPRGASQEWETPYRAILDALTLRDQAAGRRLSPEAKMEVARGDAELVKARTAYRSARYPAATSFGQAAAAAFRAAIAMPEVAEPVAPAASTAEEARSKAESALREAGVLAQVCEKQDCDGRDLTEHLRGKASLDAARKAAGAGRWDEALSAATAGIKAFDAVLTKPSKQVPSKAPDPREKQAAEDALREVQVQHELCDSSRCGDRDLEAFLRATSLSRAAKASFADQEYGRAKSQADEAVKLLRGAIASAPKGLVVPPGISRVRVVGTAILADPPFEFRTASSALTPAGQEALAEAIRVIQANKDLIAGVEVVGHTDARGNAALNQQISGSRARSVANAIGQGTGLGDRIRSEGRGSSEPIADNQSEEGRRLNRRVEIKVRLK